MSSSPTGKAALRDTPVDTKVKLAALWAATTFCYLYGDYFELYVPGKLSGMLDGKMQPLGPVTQEILLGTSVVLAIPSVMVFLSLVMKPAVNRWANVVLGMFFTLVMVLVIQGAWAFYKFLGGVEIVITLTIAWQAWSWPRDTSGEEQG